MFLQYEFYKKLMNINSRKLNRIEPVNIRVLLLEEGPIHWHSLKDESIDHQFT